MNKIELALNKLYQRQITTREQLLTEMLRVKMTQQNVKGIADSSQLFKTMKTFTEDELGFFPADRQDFYDIYHTLAEVDPVEFTLYIYKDDRMGTIISPEYLSRYISNRIIKLQPRSILIPEAEKHLSGLHAIINESPGSSFTLTTQSRLMYLLLKLTFADNANVIIRHESISSQYLADEKYDYIYLLPAFGGRVAETDDFMTKDSDGVALEAMLGHLNQQGVLDAIMPAKISFAGGGYEKLRSYVTDRFYLKSLYIFPEGIFRPVTAVRICFLTITAQLQQHTEIGSLELRNGKLTLDGQQSIPTEKIKSNPDWRVELLLSEDDDNIRRFRQSDIEKVKLKEVAEIFRGKSVLKKDTAPGNIAVLNISNINGGEIDYSAMDTIAEEEHKVKRYQLEPGDVVLSCRGTAIKSAEFHFHNKVVIASANLIVIRPKGNALGKFIKIFLESPVGIAMIKSFQRGTTIMNINHSDIAEMEIPLLTIEEQQEIVRQYENEFSIYKQAISQAENRWQQTKETVYQKLLG